VLIEQANQIIADAAAAASGETAKFSG